MEIVPKCVGAFRVDPEPNQRVRIAAEKGGIEYRLSAEEAIALGTRLIQVGKELQS